MKILMVNKLYAPDIGGGAELVLADLARGLQERGHSVRVAATTPAAAPIDETVAGVPVTRLPLHNVFWHHGPKRHGALKRLLWHGRDSSNAAMGQALRGVVARHEPDVVVFHNLAGFSAAAWEAAWSLGRPTVQVLHDYYHLCPRSQLFRDGQNCSRPCASCRVFRRGRAGRSNRLDAVVGVSQAVLDQHTSNGLFTGVPVKTVINNARAAVRSPARAYPPAARTFGFIGTLAPWKGIGQLLEVFHRIVAGERAPDIKLRVAGEGEASYVAQLKAQYASDRIEFLGRVSPDAFYPSIDACVVPSLWHDPLPGVVFESLLFGVPVIGARRGGIPEMVAERVNGMLYEPQQPGALESCIRELATHAGLVQRLGENARQGSGHFGDQHRVVDQHLDTYEAVARCG